MDRRAFLKAVFGGTVGAACGSIMGSNEPEGHIHPEGESPVHRVGTLRFRVKGDPHKYAWLAIHDTQGFVTKVFVPRDEWKDYAIAVCPWEDCAGDPYLQRYFSLEDDSTIRFDYIVVSWPND